MWQIGDAAAAYRTACLLALQAPGSTSAAPASRIAPASELFAGWCRSRDPRVAKARSVANALAAPAVSRRWAEWPNRGTGDGAGEAGGRLLRRRPTRRGTSSPAGCSRASATRGAPSPYRYRPVLGIISLPRAGEQLCQRLRL